MKKASNGPIDLHSHTTISDGTLTPEQLVAKALERNLSALAITDHDQVAAFVPACRVAQGTLLEIISGVEVSSSLDGNTLHILGLFVDPQNEGLLEYLAELRVGRLTRVETMVERLNRIAIKIDVEDVLLQAKGGTIGRMHVASVLIEKGFVASRQEAFDRFLTKDRPGFVPYEKAAPEPAIETIRQAGGRSFLAHPGLVRNQEYVTKVIEMGIDGLEVIHPEHGPAQRKKYARMCRDYGLLQSGGSDYHGPHMERKGDLGQAQVPSDFLIAIKKSLKA